MRIIGHLDMDAFFAAVEERDRPRLKGKPIVVGADPKDGLGRGVVSTAIYKAREYGIRSALPISTAWRYSEIARQKGLPPAVFLESNMKRYAEISKNIMAIVRNSIPSIEEASVDEAYLDLSLAGSYKKAEELCRKIKKEIKSKEKLTASIGIGPNKLIAKIASDMRKPDGLTVVEEKDAEKFLEPLAIRRIPGIGPKTEERFRSLGVRTVKDAKRISKDELEKMLGKWGIELYDKLLALDDSPIVQEERTPKSVGEQETFETDTLDANFLHERLRILSDEVHERFIKAGFKSFRSVTATVRFADFTTKTRSSTLETKSKSREALHFEILKLFMPFLDKRENPERKKIRLIGVRVEKLE